MENENTGDQLWKSVKSGISKLGKKIGEAVENIESEALEDLPHVAADLFETPDAIIVQIELPGIPKANISLRIQEHTLYIKGEKKPDLDLEITHYHRQERAFGPFHVSYQLPDKADVENTKATFADGVLTMRFGLMGAQPA
jgi:HSP20 family protein